MSLLSLYQVSVSAAENLHLSDTQEYAWFMKKCQNAARRLKSWQGLKPKTVCLDVDNDGRACVPCNFYRVLAVYICPQDICPPSNTTATGNPTPIRNPGGLLYYADAPALGRCDINIGNWCGTSRTFTLDGDTLQIGGYRNCRIEVAYMAYNMNVEGQMNIQESWEDYLVNYICFEYCRAFPQLKPRYIMDSYEKDYKACFRGIRSDETQVQMENDKAEITLIMNSYVGRGNLRVFN